MGNEPAPARGLGCGPYELAYAACALRPIFSPPIHHQHFPPNCVPPALPHQSEIAKRCETWLVPEDVLIVAALDTRLRTAQRQERLLAITAVWRATCRVTVRWSKRQNLAIAVGGRVTSRVIAPILTTVRAAAVLLLLVLARNAIAAVRSATLRVHAPRHPEEVAHNMAAVVVTAILVQVKNRATHAVG